MNIYLAFAVFVVALAILFKSGDWFVSGAVGMSVRLRMPKILIGIVVVGFSTTLPELLVSVQAALRGQPEIALGNAIGSVIADDTLALGLAAIVAPIAIFNRGTFRVAAIFLIVVDLIAYALAFDGHLGRGEGGLLLMGLFIYVFYAIYSARQGRQVMPTEDVAEEDSMTWGRVMLLFSSGLVGVIVASRLIIDSATTIAEFFGVPSIVIGLTIIALGTSLPEIATAVSAARKGEGEVAAGNIIGADILNILWIAGMAALVNPITVSTKIINFSFPVMIGVVLLMLFFLRTHWKMVRWEGILMVAIYIVYLISIMLLFGLDSAIEGSEHGFYHPRLHG